ncbi:bifunctional ligase/repressor BirA [Lysinibacillus alkalisoli]|uniref:Bifunctional ligase/repressor BirA n=1 Tax=Lysinibacillus alkalisoli TaxID=1911548 RepID=A0A917LFA5_9BACI|nr:biotin--[acetyl-CoA-carboxylase] ligase [Lysinibacillus alkalisoli]GGG17648.1 bifunctional ligase/repressor BirA [Lysinibacillus alkalisoli]
MTSMKDKIVKKLLASNGEAVSGQQLADEFNVSRTAIWKHMKTLQEEGYSFETIKKKGYVLTGVPNTVTAAQIKAELQTEQFGQDIYYYDVVDSTQNIAHRLAQDGAKHGTVVISEEQTAGKGRLMRPWESTRQKGIWLTVILRPDVPPHRAPQFTLVTAVAVVQALQELLVQAKPQIKWPNDVLINGKKCTGILTEMQAESDVIQALLIGIGINVSQSEADFPKELQSIATSLKLEEGIDIDRSKLIATLLHKLEIYTALYVTDGFDQIRKLWEANSCTIGQRLEVTTARETFIGEAIGITNDGVLRVQKDDGEVKEIYTADIKIL